MTLHILNRSAAHPCVADCLALLDPADALLLLEDGVYNAMSGLGRPDPLQQFLHHGGKVYAIAADVAARGLSDKVLMAVELIDYDRFVTLCTEHHPLQSWY